MESEQAYSRKKPIGKVGGKDVLHGPLTAEHASLRWTRLYASLSTHTILSSSRHHTGMAPSIS